MKTAAFILNHNLPDYTDVLYESLNPYKRDDCDLFVIDNGSPKKGVSKYTTLHLEQNVYFGGGFNAAMYYTLMNPQYDSMLFLNNDLVIHPYNFVKTLREEMFVLEEHHMVSAFDDPVGTVKYDIVSPSFYNIEPSGQCYWKSMHNWNAQYMRKVDYIDFQCPLISRRLLNEVKEIDSDLIYGWGICFYFALMAKKQGWKLGMVDRCCVLHHNSLTVKKGVAGLDMLTYCRNAELGQHRFFEKTNLLPEFQALRKKALEYEYNTN